MIKTYSIDDGTEFQTFTLPAGTLLFRGMYSMEGDTDTFYGEYRGGSKGELDCISPEKQVFFYPAPYVSHSVNQFNIHVLYTTNYDLELLLLIKPSKLYKINRNSNEEKEYFTKHASSILKICGDITSTDKCGYQMSRSDPCLTNLLMNQFPNILGYIGIDKSDASRFFAQYPSYLKYSMYSQILQILPTAVTNESGRIGIPEIVLHPLHLRRNEPMYIKREFKTIHRGTRHLIQERARYNFTPLFYVSNEDIFTLNELKEDAVIDKLQMTNPPEYISKDGLFENLNKIMEQLLSPSGYLVDGIQYQATIDTRTGFYRIRARSSNTHSNKTRKEYTGTLAVFYPDLYPDSKDTEHVPYSYTLPEKMSKMKMIEMAESAQGLDTNERVANSYGASLSNTYLFNKGNYRKKFKLAHMFPRPDLVRKGVKNVKTKKRRA